jgi:hypothetical protein
VVVAAVVWRIIQSCGLVEFYGGTEAAVAVAVAVAGVVLKLNAL